VKQHNVPSFNSLDSSVITRESTRKPFTSRPSARRSQGVSTAMAQESASPCAQTSCGS
jgi:hypothetical protein